MTAPSGGLLRGRSVDGGRGTDREWTLAPGQSVTLRAGDRLEAPTALPAPLRGRQARARRAGIRHGLGRGGRAADGWRALGLGSRWWWAPSPCSAAGTLAVRVSRREALVVGAGLLLAFAWAQGWAIYGVLDAPDLFLGGVTIERLPTSAARARPAAMDGGAADAAAGRGPRELPRVEPRAARAAAMPRRHGGVAASRSRAGSLGGGDRPRGIRRACGRRIRGPLILLALGRAAAGLGPARAVAARRRAWRDRGSIVGLAVFAALILSAELRAAGRTPASGRPAAWLLGARGDLDLSGARRGARRRAAARPACGAGRGADAPSASRLVALVALMLDELGGRRASSRARSSSASPSRAAVHAAIYLVNATLPLHLVAPRGEQDPGRPALLGRPRWSRCSCGPWSAAGWIASASARVVLPGHRRPPRDPAALLLVAAPVAVVALMLAVGLGNGLISTVGGRARLRGPRRPSTGGRRSASTTSPRRARSPSVRRSAFALYDVAGMRPSFLVAAAPRRLIGPLAWSLRHRAAEAVPARAWASRWSAAARMPSPAR